MRSQASVPSTAGTAPTEVSVIKEEEGDTGVSGRIRPPLPSGGTSSVTGAQPSRQSYLDFLREKEKLANQGDQGVHWPGLN